MDKITRIVVHLHYQNQTNKLWCIDFVYIKNEAVFIVITNAISGLPVMGIYLLIFCLGNFIKMSQSSIVVSVKWNSYLYSFS